MTKNEIEMDMKSYTGSGFITATQFAQYMGYSRYESVSKFLKDLHRIGKKYFIKEVAEAVWRAQE